MIFFFEIIKVQNENTIDYSFNHVFKDTDEKVEFAFSYPWTLSDHHVRIYK